MLLMRENASLMFLYVLHIAYISLVCCGKQGLVTWVLACYFSYVPFIANLARWLSSQNAMPEKVGVEPKGP